MEKEKMSIEDKVKIIDDLSEATKKVYDEFMKGIDKLKGQVPDRIISDLTHQAARYLDDDLTYIKKAILDQTLGDEYADAAFGICERAYQEVLKCHF